MNNSEIKVNGILNTVERRLEDIRGMSDAQINELGEELTKQSDLIKSRVNLVSLLSGREISDKAYEALLVEMKEELRTAIEDGAFFESKQVPYFDVKTQKMSTRTVYYYPAAVLVGNATDKIASEEELLIIKYGLNKYEMRRDKNQAKINALNSAKKSIKRVKREKKDIELKKDIESKNIKIQSIAALGKKLMESMSIQPVIEVKT